MHQYGMLPPIWKFLPFFSYSRVQKLNLDIQYCFTDQPVDDEDPKLPKIGPDNIPIVWHFLIKSCTEFNSSEHAYQGIHGLGSFP
jgi:hypothetical protein